MNISKLGLLAGVGVVAVVAVAGAAGDSGGGTITTVAGTGAAGFSGDGGPATRARFDEPLGAALDRNGNLYIVDYRNDRVRKVSTRGTVTTVAGGGSGAPSDGGAATSDQLFLPHAVAVDTNHNIYVGGEDNMVYRVNAKGIISPFAGTVGEAGSSGDGGPATSALLDHPLSVAVDGTGNVYIADTDNNRVRKVSRGGIITTIAGTGAAGSSGDGRPARQATLLNPSGVAVDAKGNIYIADTGNSRVRKVSRGGTITTIAGTGKAGSSGSGGRATKAQLYQPIGVSVDAKGNVYIADNYVAWKVSVKGIITRLASSTQLDHPQGVSADRKGNVYISDTGNNRVLRVR